MRPNAIGSFGAVAVTVRHRHTVWQAHVQCPASTSSAASASQRTNPLAQLRAPGRGAGAAQRRRLTEPMPCAALRNSVEFSCFSRSLSQVIPRLPPSRPRQACGRALRRASGTDGEATSEWATGAGGWGRGAGASRGGAA